MPAQLRLLFAQLIIYNNPTDVIGLWNKFKQYMNEDYRRDGKDEATADGLAMRSIADELQRANIRYTAFGLPAPIIEHETQQQSIDVVEEENQGNVMLANLNEQQFAHANEILDAIDNSNINNRCFFCKELADAAKLIYTKR
jgi:hypothetical protein